MGTARAIGVVVASLLAGTGAATAVAHDTTGRSTLEQTIDGQNPSNAFRFLRLDAGEPRLVREQLARAQPGRGERRRSLAYFGQITDFQLSDEESPARVEFVDNNQASEDFKSAHRPQEALVPLQVEFTIRQLNRYVRSPVRQGNGKRARMVNAVMTGDLADNQHKNETEAVVRLLEGGVLDPNSGSTDDAAYVGELGCPPPGTPAQDALKDEALNYTGVQDYDDYPGGDGDTEFYDPDEPAGEYAVKGFPTYTGLLDNAQEPFRARGLKVPSYVAFGNHDGLAQGNEDVIAPFETVSTGCVKPFPIGQSGGGSLIDFLSDPSKLLGDPASSLVPPDQDRQFVDKRQFKRLHATGEQRDEHGFALVDPAEERASNGAAAYYSFVPRTRAREVRYIVLDTLSEGGVVSVSSRGNIDDPQWRWLRGELAAAERRDELVVVFAHHATTSLDADAPDELASPCTVGDEHGHDVNPGCDRDPRRSTPLHFGDDLVELFHRHPSVIALVAGHSHENEIQPYEGPGGGFWEIKSPAIIDWPPQHRVLEVMDNRDGTLSIFATLLDHDGPSRSPGSSSEAQVDALTPAELASIGRTISFNDPQVGPGPQEGLPRDRNVELLIGDPREDPSPPGGGPASPDNPPNGDGGPGGPVDDDSQETGRDGGSQGEADAGPGGEDDAAVALGAGGDGGALPFTGLGLGLLLLVGALLVGAGTALRRRSAR
jgi:metallophosphoesterase (TIGR03767 family)